MSRYSSDLMLDIQAVIDAYAEAMAEQIMAEWMRIGYAPELSGEAEVKTKVRKLSRDTIVCAISGEGQRALMMEYGKGSLMDLSNPALAEYLAWEHFNIDRAGQGMAVLSRKRGEAYQDLDGNPKVSRATSPGKNLEELDIPKYKPFPPMHVVRNVVCGENGEEGMLPAVLGAIAECIATYDFFDKLPDQIRL